MGRESVLLVNLCFIYLFIFIFWLVFFVFLH